MKHLKLIGALAGLFAAVVTTPMLQAADVTTFPYPVPATGSYAPAERSSSSAAVSASTAVIVALNAQSLMLKEMLHEHQGRATDLTQKNQSERAKWETELVNELQESAQVQKSIDQTSAGSAENLSTGGNADDEVVFVSVVEARQAQVREDLSSAIADSRVLSQQVATNKAPESIAALSTVLGENQKLVKELQRDLRDLELRKLEFRAMLKRMQK